MMRALRFIPHPNGEGGAPDALRQIECAAPRVGDGYSDPRFWVRTTQGRIALFLAEVGTQGGGRTGSGGSVWRRLDFGDLLDAPAEMLEGQ